MKHLQKYMLVFSVLLALTSCDNGKSKETTATNSKQDVTQIQNSSNSHTQIDASTPAEESIKDPTERFHNKSLSVLDTSEVIIDGVSTLIVTFSVPLNPKQHFDHLLRLVDSKKKEVDGYWELSENGLELRHRYLEPNKTLTLSIDRMLMAVNESRLDKLFQTEIKTRDRTPMVGFTSAGSLLPSESMTGLPVTTLNVDKIDVNFYRVKEDKIFEFMQDYGANRQLSVWSAEHALNYTDLIYSARFDLNPQKNVQENVIINLADIDQFNEVGTYIAILNQAGSYKYSMPMTVFSISNIGLSVHHYLNGKLAVFAHQLDSGKALADVELTIATLCKENFDKCFQQNTKTNEQGYAEFSVQQQSDYHNLLIAKDGQQMSFIYLDRGALDLSEFNLSGSPYYAKQLFVFGPRDLYRPQETVYLNALLRDSDGQLVDEQPIKVEVINPTGQVAKDFVWQPISEQSGFYQKEFTIPVNAATGQWTVRFNLGDDVYRYHYFSVEEFLPERMSLSLSTDSNSAILIKDNANFEVNGWYLYGAPAAGNDLQADIYLQQEHDIPNLAGFKIGSVLDSNINRHVESLVTSLDNNGYAEISVDKNNWQDIHSPVNVVLQANLLDIGGRPVTRTITQSIWPAQNLPAIRPLFSEKEHYDWSVDQYVERATVELGQFAEFEVAYVDAQGNKLSKDSLTARFVRERKDYYWTWSDTDGWRVQYDEKEFVVLEEKLSVEDGQVTKIGFLPDDVGAYRLEVIDRHNIISSIRFWNGYSWLTNTDGSNIVRPDQVKLTLDKPAYKVGDIAKVHIEAPVSGSGYVSLENNDGTLWMQEIDVTSEGLNVDIPIQDWKRHDIYINAMVIRPSIDSATQTVKRALGILYLPIDTTQRQLQLSFDAPDKTQPEKAIKVKVKLPSEQIQEKQTVSVLLSAVDTGVLNITNYTTPDPYSALLGRKRFDVEVRDVYNKLIEGSGRIIGNRYGGDSDEFAQGVAEGGKKPLREIKIIAQQFQTVILDEDGSAEVEMTIPDFNGELRLMAQVWDKERYGRAEQKLVVAAPVIAELSTPRFLSGGDTTIMAFELRNLTPIEQHLNINIQSEGLINLAEVSLPSDILLLPQERKIIQIPVIAKHGFGQGKIKVIVDGITVADDDNYQINRSWVIGIRPSYNSTIRTFPVVLNDGESWTIAPSVLTDMIGDSIESEVVISSQPPFNITRYVKALFAYPYGCLEQVISGLYPTLYANHQQLAEIGIESEPDEERTIKIQMGIDRIFSMQRHNGSFGLWSKENSEEFWLTAYAVDFLLQVQERGYQVNQEGLNKSLNRLAEYLYDSSAFYSLDSYYDRDVTEYSKFATKTYAALLLAKQNRITPAIRNELKRLYQQVKSNENSVLLSPLPIMQLSIASKLAGYNKSSNDLLSLALKTPRDSQYYWLGDYGSTIRDKAQIYTLMVTYSLAKNRQANLLLDLSNDLNNIRYLSTQELNALFIAAWNNRQQESDAAFSVILNKDKITSKNSLYRSLNFADLSEGFTITNPNDKKPLYVLFTLSGYDQSLPEPTSKNNVLQISRSYFDTKGNPISIEKLQVGDLVVTMLDVRSKKVLNDALIVDLLPAGLELENQNLTHSGVNIQSIPELAKMLQYENGSDIKYQKYLDDRFVAAVNIHDYFSYDQYRTRVIYLARAVTVGEYVIPQPYVESMYKPEWSATGKSYGKLSIVGKK